MLVGKKNKALDHKLTFGVLEMTSLETSTSPIDVDRIIFSGVVVIVGDCGMPFDWTGGVCAGNRKPVFSLKREASSELSLSMG